MIHAAAPAEPALGRLPRPALIVGLVGLALSAAGAFLDPDQFFRSYLCGFVFFLGLGLGSLGIVLLQFVTGGRWGAVSRRVLEASISTLPLMALLYLPLLPGLRELYVWARPEAVGADPLLQHKSGYLNLPFFLVRAVVYFSAWCGLAYTVRRWSAEQDRSADPGLVRRFKRLGNGGLILLGLTVTFAAIDWLMSLEPDWWSTIYGAMVAVGELMLALAFTVIVLGLLARRGPLAGVATPAIFNDLGSLLLAFLMLWAYMSFAQFLLIWAGNLTDENPWYLRRLAGGWQWVGLAIGVFGFLVPFVLLLFRPLKRDVARLSAVAGLLIVMRLVNDYWLIQPVFATGGPRPHWLDLTLLVGLGGVWLARFAGRLGSRPLLPVNDPRLREAPDADR